MKKGALNYYELNSELYDDSGILSIIELEKNFVALCSEVTIKIYYYNGKKYSKYMIILPSLYKR